MSYTKVIETMNETFLHCILTSFISLQIELEKRTGLNNLLELTVTITLTILVNEAGYSKF